MKRGFCWAGRLRSIVDRLASRNAPLVALAATTVWVRAATPDQAWPC